VLNDFAVLTLKISTARLRSPAYIASVNHHEIALCDDHADLVGEVLL
jgi:hypothetical protein